MDEKNSIRVLIVDDNELTRSLLNLILRSGQYQIVGEATTAKAGLELAIKLRPDVILLDNNMPNGNGLDVVQPLRKALPESVILMVTTQSDQRVITGAMERGANGFVVKPFNTASVLNTMQEASQKFVLASPPECRCKKKTTKLQSLAISAKDCNLPDSPPPREFSPSINHE